jgi:hypothetical protein
MALEGLEALVLIFRQAPVAIIHGRFQVDDWSSVYGLPARLVGVLLLQIAVMAVGDVVYWEFIRGRWDWPDWYLLTRLGLFFGGIIGAPLICVLFREGHRE